MCSLRNITTVCPRPKKSTSGLDSTFWVLIGIAGGVVAAAVLIIILWKIVTTCKVKALVINLSEAARPNTELLAGCS